MTLYLISVAVIVAACYGLYRALQESDAERALTYPLGSYERQILEGGRRWTGQVIVATHP